jgi:hypothetical protein
MVTSHNKCERKLNNKMSNGAQGPETGKHVFSSLKLLLISLGQAEYYPSSAPWVAVKAIAASARPA